MAYFSDTVSAVLSGITVRVAHLVHLDFASDPKRLWMGFGTLTAGGENWSGLGELGSISGLDSAMAGTAPLVTLSLSGVDPSLVATALTASDEVKGRDVTIYVQFFDDDLSLLDSPYAIYGGTMDLIKVQAPDPTSRTVEVTAETLFARRALPPWGYLTDRDQNALFPGDFGLEHIPSMANKTVKWPPSFDADTGSSKGGGGLFGLF